MPTEEPRFIADYADYWALRRGDQEALVSATLRWTYRDLATEVDRIACALLANQVGRGDRIGMIGTPSPESFAIFLAVSRIGAITVGMNPKFSNPELEYVLANANPSLVIDLVNRCDDSLRDQLGHRLKPVMLCGAVARSDALLWDEFLSEGDSIKSQQVDVIRKDLEPSTPCLMVYTSGTTGKPKGAVLPNHGLVYCGQVQAGLWLADPLRLLVNLPINHVGFMSDMCAYCLVAGGTAVFMNSFDPVESLRLIESERITAWGQIPTMFQLVVASPEYAKFDLSSLQLVIWGGAYAPTDLLNTLAETGAQLATSYGMTETTGSVTYTAMDASLEELRNTVGRPDPHFEVRIADANGRVVFVGEEGEVQVRGNHIMIEYWNNPKATAEAIDAEGWLHTGDVAVLREDGAYALRGRLTGMYKSGGENVYPREVEEALEAHPSVAIAAVIGMPDPIYSEVGHAFIVLHETASATSEEVRTYCKTRLANFKVPKAIEVCQELPLLPIGKVDKVALKARLQEG